MQRPCLALALALVACGSLQGATISWSIPAQITGASDVIQSASPFQVNDFGASDYMATIIDGMTFSLFGGDATFNPLTIGNLTFTPASPHDMGGIALFGSAIAPYTSLPTAYQTMIGSSYYVDNGQLTITISGLQVGQSYQLRFWVNDSRGCCANRTEVLDSNGSQATLSFNTTHVEGGLGQYVTGSFLADDASQSFTVTGSDPDNSVNASQVNGLEILTVTNLCDLDNDGSVNVSDVQLRIKQALGLAFPVDDLNADGVIDVVDVQDNLEGALNMTCPTTTGAALRTFRPSTVLTRALSPVGRPFLTEGGTVIYGVNRNRMVGSAWFEDSAAFHAFLFNGVAVTDLGTLGGASSMALSMNSPGLIVGWADTGSGQTHAFLWSAGSMVDLNDYVTLEDDVTLREATSIDDAGRILASGSDGRTYLIAVPNQFR